MGVGCENYKVIMCACEKCVSVFACVCVYVYTDACMHTFA